jgi:phage baseplate assembly protein V
MAGSDTWMNQLERWIAPWKRRILSMIGKCIISAIDDSGNLQLHQIKFLSDEVISGVERVQEFGFTSHPPANSEGVVAFLGGNQQHGVIIATDSSTYRLKGLPEGACAIYNKNGDYVKLTENKIEVHADSVELGTGSFKKLVNEEFQAVFNNHTHGYTLPLHPSTENTPTSGPSESIGNDELTSKTTAE